MKVPEVKGKYWTILITVLILAFAMMYYFLIHAANNAANFNDTCYRDLNRVSKNLKQKFDIYTSNAEFIVQKAADRLYSRGSLSKDIDSTNFLSSLEEKIEIVQKESGSNKNLLYINHINKNDTEIDNTESDVINLFAGISNKKVLDSFSYHKNERFVFMTKIEPFFSPVFGSSIFDAYLVKRNNQVFSSVLSHVDFQLPDSAINNLRAPINLGGSEYIAFRTSIDNSNEDNKFYIYGLVSMEKYRAARYRFNPWFIFILTAALLIIFLAIPIVKIVSLSPIEELSKKDSMFIMLSVIVGSSVLMLLLLSLTTNEVVGNAESDARLETLSDSISANFLQEVQNASATMENLDNLLLQKLEEQQDVDDVEMLGMETDMLDSSSTPYLETDNMKLVFWMDETGLQKKILSILNHASPPSILAHRDYFKDVVGNKLWVLDNNSYADTLTIESIRSVTSGECLAAISKKSHIGNKVTPKIEAVALTTPLKSIIDAALPYGMQYCIVNNEGDVWFHSEKDFNLQENILVETNKNVKLASAMKTRVARHFSCRYHNEIFSAYIQPIENTPLQIITLYDKEITNSFNSQVFSISFLFVLFTLLALVLLSIILMLTNLKNDRFYNSFYSFDWLRFSNSIEYSWKYRIVVFGNLIIILLFLIFNAIVFNSAGINKAVGISSSVLVAVLVFAFNYYILSLNHVSIYKFSRLSKLYMAVPLKLRFIYLAAIYLALIVWGFVKVNKDIAFVLVILMVVVISLWIFLIKLPRRNGSEGSLNFYFLMLFSWLVIFSILPSANAFKVSYDIENEIRIKQALFETAGNYKERTESILDYYEDVNGINLLWKKEKVNDGYYACNYQLATNLVSNSKARKDSGGIYASISPRFGNSSSQNRDFYYATASDKSWVSALNDTSITVERRFQDNSKVILKAPFRKLRLRKNDENQKSSIFFVIAIPVFLFLIFQFLLIRYLATKLFGINLVPELKKDLTTFQELSENQFVFVVGLSGSGKSNLVSSGNTSVDMSRLTDPVRWEKELSKITSKSDKLVLDNMEYDLYNIASWNKKLHLLNELYRSSKKVTILSQIHPDQVLKYYEELMHDEMQDDKGDEGDENIFYDLRAKYYEWQQLLDRYIIFHYPLMNSDISNLISSDEYRGRFRKRSNIISEKHLTNKFRQEVSDKKIFYFNPLSSEKISSIIASDDIIDRITGDSTYIPSHELLHNYFYSIWRTIPIDEKYVLYDFAKDGFINSNNTRTINSLAKKGLLLNKGSLVMISNGFRQFILSVLKPEDEFRRTKEIKVRGRWNTFRIVLILIILALFVFIWFGNQKILADFKAIIISLAAISSLLVRFGGVMGKS